MTIKYMTNRLAQGVMLLVLVSAPVAQAATVAEALAATQRNEYAAALDIWRPLATAGNSLAQYNLGLFYKNGWGLNADPQQARYWFTRAAHGGVVNSFQQLGRANLIAPGKAPHVDLVLGPQEWIQAQSAQHYTLQLATSNNRGLIERYYNEHQLQGRGGYFLQQGRYSLVSGTYASVAEASEAIGQLPEELRRWSPWVRQFREIQQAMITDG